MKFEKNRQVPYPTPEKKTDFRQKSVKNQNYTNTSLHQCQKNYDYLSASRINLLFVSFLGCNSNICNFLNYINIIFPIEYIILP